METFRTLVPVESSGISLDFDKPVCFLGSCFSTHMAKRMNRSGFSIGINPNGIVFHPVALAAGLQRTLEDRAYDESELIQSGEEWLSLLHHGSFRMLEKNDLLEKMEQERRDFRDQLSHASVLFVTFGTAFGYLHGESKRVVANCHKLPGDQFVKQLTTSAEIIATWSPLIKALLKFNPSLKLVFTLSPVRYLKEGAHQNQLSKAQLLLAIEALVNEFEQLSYFPSYELVLDELRDYRFFADDMIHLSDKAADYVFARLCDAYLEDGTKTLSRAIAKRTRILDHRFKEDVQALNSRETVLNEIRGMLESAGYQQASKRLKWL